jgi:hypothetical protein
MNDEFMQTPPITSPLVLAHPLLGDTRIDLRTLEQGAQRVPSFVRFATNETSMSMIWEFACRCGPFGYTSLTIARHYQMRFSYPVGVSNLLLSRQQKSVTSRTWAEGRAP